MTILKCDHCDAETEGTQMICVSVKSHKPDADGRAVQARVNSQRWWRFCGKACADEWYATETDEHLMPAGPAPEPISCDAHPEGEHDFSIPAKDLEVAAAAIIGGTFTSSPSCSRCGRTAHEVGGACPHLIDDGPHRDRLLRMLAVHVTAKDGTELCDHQIFDEPHELNAYWKTPGAPLPLTLGGSDPEVVTETEEPRP